MVRYIDAHGCFEDYVLHRALFGNDIEFIDYVNQYPTADVVSKDLYDQVKWERDQAFRTLREHGIDLGQRAEPSELHAHWIEVAYPNKRFLCSNCCHGRGYKTDVCPCCEAIMDEEVE